MVPPGDVDERLLAPVLLWTQVACVWMLANYALQDPSDHREVEEKKHLREMRKWKQHLGIRAALLTGAAAALPGFGTTQLVPRVLIAALMLFGMFIMALGRVRVVERRAPARSPFRDPVDLRARRGIWLAEWELGTHFVVLLAVALVIGAFGVTVEPLLVLPVRTGRLICFAGICALVVFLARGGAHVVRGFMNKVGTLPTMTRQPEGGVDWVEYNRGRMIGVLERMLLALFMAVQAYQAIGLLIAAKGLIRSKELEDRGFAEYFLVGTLASTLLAIGAGVLIQLLLHSFW
ncbi:MAG TPA: hypothetical protein VIB55_21095 [Longimicrobium sp.]|jgi:hypothetical protein